MLRGVHFILGTPLIGYKKKLRATKAAGPVAVEPWVLSGRDLVALRTAWSMLLAANY